MNILPNIKTGISVCPHDCPSACALEVEVLDEHTIGRVRGAKDNSYTLGVICEKVGRYAERIHHPDRLLHPLKRKGPKGSGEFQRISWDDAMAETAEAHAEGRGRVWRRQPSGPISTPAPWAYVMRDGINRLRHAKRYSNMDDTFCVALSWSGYLAGTGLDLGRRSARDAEVGPDRDLGRQPGEHPGQCHDPRHDGAQEPRARRSPASTSTTPAP